MVGEMGNMVNFSGEIPEMREGGEGWNGGRVWALVVLWEVYKRASVSGDAGTKKGKLGRCV